MKFGWTGLTMRLAVYGITSHGCDASVAPPSLTRSVFEFR